MWFFPNLKPTKNLLYLHKQRLGRVSQQLERAFRTEGRSRVNEEEACVRGNSHLLDFHFSVSRVTEYHGEEGIRIPVIRRATSERGNRSDDYLA